MRFAARTTDDPGGQTDNAEAPKFHDDLSHRPFVAITNSNTPKVQIVPEFIFSFQSEALAEFKQVIAGGRTTGTNGHTRVVAMDGGLLQYPPGPQPEGTPVRLYPIFLTDPENADAVENKIVTSVQGEVAARVRGAVFNRFVGHPKDAIYELEAERAQREHALRMGLPHLYIADEATRTSGDDNAAVEVNHEQPAEGTEEAREVESEA